MAGNPKEQRSPTPDIAFLHERGGLTPAHWEGVVGRIISPTDPIGTKIVAYGQKVINREFPDTENFHRSYLGRRHWDLVSKLDTHDKVQTQRKFPPWPKIESHLNQTVEECVEYAEREKNICYTLDDHIDYLKQIFERNQQKEWYQFDPSVGRWRHHRLYDIPDTPGGWLPAASHDWSRYDAHTEEEVSDRIDVNWLIRMWLLTEDDVQDPLHTSPQELESLVRTGVPVEVLNERLKESKHYQFVVDWEKDIPN